MKKLVDEISISEFQYIIKFIENGSLSEIKKVNEYEKLNNRQRLILKLVEEFGELAENIRLDVRYDGKNIKGTIEEELFDIFYYIAAIANEYDINLQEIFYLKDKLNKEKYNRDFTIEDVREKYKNK